MAEKLFIYLHTDDTSNPSWAILDEGGNVRDSAWHDGVEGLTLIAAEKVVIVLVPSEEVLLTSAELPPLSGARLLQALPFVLEDELIDDIETLHFAPAKLRDKGRLAIAVVSHIKMKKWLNLLQSWGVEADVLIPALLALPYTEKEWYASFYKTELAKEAVEEGMVMIKTGDHMGFTCDYANFPLFLQKAFNDLAVIPNLHMTRYSLPSISLQLLENLTVVDEARPKEAFIADLAKGAPSTFTLNLLQGTYASSKSYFSHTVKLWKISAAFAAVWVAWLFFYPLVSFFILQSKYDGVNRDIKAIYRKHFPETSNVIAPSQRLKEKWEQLNNETGHEQVLILLGYVGEALKSYPQLEVKRLDYQNMQLTLEVSAETSEIFSAFADKLTAFGLQVKQHNAVLKNSHLEATLQIE